jgi:MFS-type transporter involved in bile tolerance (Atg22 family)
LGGAALYRLNPAFPFWMGSALVLLSTILVFLFIKEPQVQASSEKQAGMWQSLVSLAREKERSAFRLLMAIFFWFLGYSAIEAFFTLYAVKHLGVEEAGGAQLLGQLSFVFVIFALPAGYIGSRLGRRNTVLTGLVLMAAAMLAMFFFPISNLTSPLTRIFGLGDILIISLILMLAGAAWALININSLPMVVDMTEPARIGTYTGLYYLFSTLSAIVGPNINGWIIELTGREYNSIMIVAPFFLLTAMLLISGVHRGEAFHEKMIAFPAD